MNTEFKAVLFDLDDTLFDHRHSCREGLRAVWKRYTCFQEMTLDEFEIEHSKLLERIHFTQVLLGKLSVEEARAERFRHAFLNRGIEVDHNTACNAAEIYRNAYQKVVRKVSGAEQLLKTFKKSYKIGIVTNNLIEEQVQKLKNLGLDGYVDSLVTSEEIGHTKPHPLIFETAMKRLGVTPAETIMIGDSWEHDIAGAFKLGIKCLWLNLHKAECPDKSMAIEIRSLEHPEYIKSLITSLRLKT